MSRPGKWNIATMSWDMDVEGMGIKTGYLNQVYWPNRFQEMIGKARRALNEIQQICPFDCIVFQGQSGCAIGYALGAITGIPMINLRKESDDSHHRREIVDRAEGCSNVGLRYLIVDDFISSGSTVTRIYEEISKFRAGAVCIGILTYSGPVREDRKQWCINNVWRGDKCLYVPCWHVCETHFMRPQWLLNGPALEPKKEVKPAPSKSQGEVMFEKAVEDAIVYGTCSVEVKPGVFEYQKAPRQAEAQQSKGAAFLDQLAALADRLFVTPIDAAKDEYLDRVAAMYGVPKEYLAPAAKVTDPRDVIDPGPGMWPGFTPLPVRRDPPPPAEPRTGTESPDQDG